MSPNTYWKVPFEWREPRAPVEDELPVGLSWATGGATQAPIDLVGEVLATSPGPEDQHAVSVHGREEAARHILGLASGFSYLPDRWHVLMAEGTPVGFVLPVIYDGCARDGLDEATIYHMGVASQSRGSGFGRLLLRRATRTLVDHGVWRIYCDTPASNTPMIRVFEAEGWLRLPIHERTISS
jgi:ribosomal protein S18 acetylase RimI-like enzyme